MGTYSFHNHLGSWGLETDVRNSVRGREEGEKKKEGGGGEKGRGGERWRDREKEEKEGNKERGRNLQKETRKNSLASLKSNDYQVFFHPLL